MRIFLITFILTFTLAGVSAADSMLGAHGVELSVGTADKQTEAALSVDVRVTQFHGVQADLDWIETDMGELGRVAGHLYLQPGEVRKYGVFASLADLNGHDVSYGVVGAEGLYAIGQATEVELKAGLGWANVHGLDTVFAGVGLQHALSPVLMLDLGVDIAAFDETWIEATGTQIYLALRYTPKRSVLSVRGELRHDRLRGSDVAQAETELYLSLMLTYGQHDRASPNGAFFRTADPFKPLLRRGLLRP